jgi:molybdate transport system ATP-binding protein
VSDLRSEIVVTRSDGFRLELSLTALPGEVVALLGPNGAGKTTALRALAGLVRLDSGQILLDGSDISQLPPERRRIGVVFQDYLLFPHLTALDNVAFGPRSTGASKAASREVASRWLDRVGLAAYSGAKPGQLSGGQAQRVALARALATKPRLLLLDEPLAALDARTRAEIRADLRHHLSEFDGASIVVTHDPLDAMVLADRIVVIEDGRQVQAGTPAEIVRRPRTEYVARLAGLNLYRGRAEHGLVTLDGGGHLATGDDVSGPVFAAFPPAAVSVHTHRPDGSPRNVWAVEVDGIEPHADRVRVSFRGEPPVAAEVTTAAAAELDLRPGSAAWVAVKATEVHAYPA